MKVLAPLVLLAALALAKKSYEGHQVLQVHPETEEHVRLLENMREQAELDLDFWGGPAQGHPCDIDVSRENKAAFTSFLDYYDIKYEVVIEDLQKLIDEEESSNHEARRKRSTSQISSIAGTFADTNEMNNFMEEAAASYWFASVINIGKSYEDRDMKVLKLSTGGGKKAILMDAGIHAREWLSQSTLIWIMNKMVTEYGSQGQVDDLLEEFDWYFLPNANPDGYEYSRTQDRMWRKTRSSHGNVFCKGVDANRNFDFPVFGGEGTSSISCSDIYKGPTAFSEPETQNMRDYLLGRRDDAVLYVALHSYTQLVLTRWGYTNERADDHEEQMRVGKIAAEAIKGVHGSRFTVGPAPMQLYAAAGGADDWARGGAGIEYTYTLELRPSNHYSYGFVAPASEIVPSGQEVFAGVRAMAKAIKY